VTQRTLCRVEALEDNTARGFGPANGGFTGLFAVRRGEVVFVYVNSCPHIGVPLDWAPERFLSTDRRRIVCSMHGAEFRIEDGFCTQGPCQGEHLEAVLVTLADGMILVPEDAGL
jgi:nitrite reductase/ring-hydroxylating ferredoxin subunit